MAVSDLTVLSDAYQLRYAADPPIEALTFTATHSMMTEIHDVALHLIQRIAWAFNWDVDRTTLQQYSKGRYKF